MMTARLFGRTTFSLLLALLLASPALLAQDEDGSSGDDEEPGEFDDFDFSDLPVDDYKELDYVGIGIGYHGSHTFLDNETMGAIAADMDLGEFSPGLTSFVGGGFFIGGLGFKNVRYGLYSMSGSKEVSANVDLPEDETDPTNTTPYNRKLVYSSGFLGLQLDYALFLPPEGLVFFPGLMIGRESSEIELFQTRSSGLSYNTLFNRDEFDGSASVAGQRNRYSRIERNSFQLRPTLTLDYAVNQFVVLRVGGGYGINFEGDWEQSSGTPISDVPDLNSAGASLHFGLFLGLFQK